MSLDTLVVILLVWTVAGLMAAILFGKAIRENNSSYDEEPLPASADMMKFFRKSETYETAPSSDAVKMQGKTTQQKSE